MARAVQGEHHGAVEHVTDALSGMRGLLGAAAFLLTGLMLTVSDAAARVGTSHLIFSHPDTNVNGTGSSISTGVGIVIVVGVLVIFALTVFMVWRLVRSSSTS